jgi:probable addiction module antidote protein
MTSKKLGFCLNDIPQRKLKADADVLSVSSAARLRDQQLIFKALWQCLVEQDIEAFKEVLRGHIEAVNKKELAKRSKTSRRTIYRVLSREGNPTLKSVAKVIHALYG